MFVGLLEVILVGFVLIFIVTYRSSSGNGVYRFINEQAQKAYGIYAPYSFKEISSKVRKLGLNYTTKDYAVQIVLFGGIAAAIAYLYFYSLIVVIIYVVIAIAAVPYVAYLNYKRRYSEFLFEQIQVYTTNTIMEFATTQAFVKSLEGVVESGVLEDPVLSDVKTMIALSYEKGDVYDSIAYMNAKYPYYMVKNMHQLFLQVTKEGAKDTQETFDNMLQDIDALVEGVYRDRMDRAEFHKQFLLFGVALYGLVMLIQLLLGVESYISLLNTWWLKILLHLVVFINTWFLLKGERFYNENVGAE